MYASLIGRIGDIWRRIVSFVGCRLMARQRGLKLLEANLTPDQLKQFLATRRFDVVGGVTGRTYRIRMAAGPMHVQELDPEGIAYDVYASILEAGWWTATLCSPKKLRSKHLKSRHWRLRTSFLPKC